MFYEDCIIIIIVIIINTVTYSFRHKIIIAHTLHVSLHYTVEYSMTIFLTRLNSNNNNNNNNTRYVLNEDLYNSWHATSYTNIVSWEQHSVKYDSQYN